MNIQVSEYIRIFALYCCAFIMYHSNTVKFNAVVNVVLLMTVLDHVNLKLTFLKSGKQIMFNLSWTYLLKLYYTTPCWWWGKVKRDIGRRFKDEG